LVATGVIEKIIIPTNPKINPLFSLLNFLKWRFKDIYY
jgi:hypothetical protein